MTLKSLSRGVYRLTKNFSFQVVKSNMHKHALLVNNLATIMCKLEISYRVPNLACFIGNGEYLFMLFIILVDCECMHQ